MLASYLQTVRNLFSQFLHFVLTWSIFAYQGEQKIVRNKKNREYTRAVGGFFELGSPIAGHYHAHSLSISSNQKPIIWFQISISAQS